MEFEDEHDEEQEEEEDEDEITIPPLPTPSSALVPPNYDLLPNSVGSTPPSRPHRVTDRIRSSVVRHRECLRNHAVHIGGHAVDGCGEFMPAGVEGTLDALKCAACNCHRSFHRKETDVTAETLITTTPHHNHLPPPHQPPQQSLQPLGPPLYPQFSAYYRTPAPASGSHQYRPLAALPSTSGGTQSGDDMSHPSSSGGEGRRESGGGMMMVPKKRFRTKFSQEQKDKMLEFAEKLGWRIQKHDESAVQQFCAEVQVKRQVLKVWMHNNKQTLGKKP